MKKEKMVFCNCSSCPILKSCCSRLSNGYDLDAPQVFNAEASIISSKINANILSFANEREGHGSRYYELKTHKGKCLFSSGGRCEIYDSRPIDCKLFPFDLRMIELNVFWIIYVDLCKGIDDVYKALLQAKGILQTSNIPAQEIISYSQNVSTEMDKKKFIRLDKFVLGN